MPSDLQTSLDDKRYGVGSSVNNMKRINITQAAHLMAIYTQDSVVYLTNKQTITTSCGARHNKPRPLLPPSE